MKEIDESGVIGVLSIEESLEQAFVAGCRHLVLVAPASYAGTWKCGGRDSQGPIHLTVQHGRPTGRPSATTHTYMKPSFISMAI
jgi:hypothetical protein